MPLIGYARVSTEDQNTAAQVDALQKAGCTVIYEDTASGGSRDRPNLARALGRVGEGDTLIVMRIDRLARSLTHLLEIIDTLKSRGAGFRSIMDPIDTTSAQGMLMTQLLGAFAEFERSLIRERTKAGVQAAVARGARPGNPKMIDRDPFARIALSRTMRNAYLRELKQGYKDWLPTVLRLRPHLSWKLVLRSVQAIKPPVRSFSERTLVKACKALVDEGLAPAQILETAKRPALDDRVPRLVAAQLLLQPDASLRNLANWLTKDLREPTPRGGLVWTAEGVKREIEKAKKLKLLPRENPEIESGPD